MSRATAGRGDSAGRGGGANLGAASRLEWLPLLALTAAVFAVYAFTAPRTVTLEDDGLFIMASVDAGVAHPPGYPLYTLLGYVFSHLPVGAPALRIHLLSGLLGALACAALFLLARRSGVALWLALAAALAYGVSEHFWSQAIIAEVYTLNALLIFGVLLFCLQAAEAAEAGGQAGKGAGGKRGGGAPRTAGAGPAGLVVTPLSLAALCFGLGLANHWPLMLLAAPAFAILLWPCRQIVYACLPRLLLIVFLSSGALYLWMVWRSWQPGVVAFYGPLTTLEDFWYYVSRQGYGGVDASPSAGFADKIGFAAYFAKESLFLFTPVGALLAGLGVYHLYLARRWLLAATVWIFFAHSLLLILALGFDYEYLNVAVFRPYPLVAYGMLALWMGHGLDALFRHAGMPRLARALPLLALLIPVVVLQKNFTINNRSEDRFAERYGRMILDGLEPNAVLFVVGDTTTAPLGYLHYAEGARPDIELINTQGLVYPTRLFIPPTTSRVRKQAFEHYMRDNRRPVYMINRIDEIPNPHGTVHFGFYQKIDPQGKAAAITLHFEPHVTEYFESLSRDPLPRDRWNRHQHSVLLQQYGNFLGYTIMSDDPQLKRIAADKVKVMENRYYGLVDMAEVLIEHGFHAEHLRIAAQLLEKAEPLADETLSKALLGRHHYRRGFLAYRLGDLREAQQQFRASARAHDHPDNPSHNALKIIKPERNHEP